MSNFPSHMNTFPIPKEVIDEITKTPDSMNQVVSAFHIDDKTYRKLIDISGRPDVPP